MDDDGFDDVVSDEELAAAVRRRVLVDDEFFEQQWELYGPAPPPRKSLPVRVVPASLDNPWGHKRHLEEKEAAPRQKKKYNPLLRGRYR